MQIISNQTLKIKIELDATQIVIGDPGQGTPILIRAGNHTASWECGTATGELDAGDHQLTAAQMAWLESRRPFVEEWMEKNCV